MNCIDYGNYSACGGVVNLIDIIPLIIVAIGLLMLLFFIYGRFKNDVDIDNVYGEIKEKMQNDENKKLP